MVSINLPESVKAHLDEIAQRENRDVVEVIENMITQYTPRSAKKAIDWSLILGISDSEITDMSATVRETLDKYYQQKYGNSD
jgi:hypothetical protein